MTKGKVIRIEAQRSYIIAFLIALNGVRLSHSADQINTALTQINGNGPFNWPGLQAFGVEIVNKPGKKQVDYVIDKQSAESFIITPMRAAKSLLAALRRRDISEDAIRRALRIADKYKAA